MNYETVIGLEIHIQLKTESKMFCRCSNKLSRKDTNKDSERHRVKLEVPNTRVCPVCLGLPGSLPVANKKAIEKTMLLGLALNGEIMKRFNFERKNYFYPDLPKAYQITSSTNFPVKGGHLEIEAEDGGKRVKIHHIHLEEDAGKLLHEADEYSLVDLNRASTPLVELVTEPDISTPAEAKDFVQKLRSIVRTLGISDANMEAGNLRCDANISLRKKGEPLGSKVEIKNLNSFKMIERALEHEQERQAEILDLNNKVVQETRGWDDNKGKTLPQRLKEEALDYRYFPDPDLPLIETAQGREKNENGYLLSVEELKELLPELPKEKEVRFISEYGLNPKDAIFLSQDVELSKYFEKVVEGMPEITDGAEVLKDRAKKASNWILSELFGILKANKLSFSENEISAKDLSQLLELIQKGTISGKTAKEVFAEMFETNKEAITIVKEKGLQQITGTGEIENIVDKVINENEKVVQEYRSGRVQVIGFLVGKVMAESKGQANPKAVNEILIDKLKA